VLLPHEFLQIVQISLSFPVFCSYWPRVVQLLSQVGQAVLLFPSVESVSHSQRGHFSEEGSQLDAFFRVNPCFSFVTVEFSLHHFDVPLLDDVAKILSSFILGVREIEAFRDSKGSDILERISHNLSPHNVLKVGKRVDKVASSLIVSLQCLKRS